MTNKLHIFDEIQGQGIVFIVRLSLKTLATTIQLTGVYNDCETHESLEQKALDESAYLSRLGATALRYHSKNTEINSF